jgi:hypothetical protein
MIIRSPTTASTAELCIIVYILNPHNTCCILRNRETICHLVLTWIDSLGFFLRSKLCGTNIFCENYNTFYPKKSGGIWRRNMKPWKMNPSSK